jgi:hypothetical protein
MSALNNSLLLGQEGGGGYAISRSLRFNSADSAYLSRTPASAGNRKTWTWAGWVKRSALGARQGIFGSISSDALSYTILEFSGTEDITLYDSNAGGGARVTASLYRDFSAWYHIVLVYDTTQATANNRIRLYVNGAEVTAFSTTANPALNSDGRVNNTVAHSIGSYTPFSGGYYLNGYLADIHFIDGQALDPTSFGEFSATTGVWMPKKYTGTYGTNGFKLDFSDNSAATATTLGKDSSGNGNNWTPNNLSVTAGAGNDSLVDVPTNGSEVDTGSGGQVRGNYCTINPLRNPNGDTFSNGNLEVTTSVSGFGCHVSTMATPLTGKWYAEVTIGNGNGLYSEIGLVDSASLSGNPILSQTTGVAYASWEGKYYKDTVSTSYGTAANLANGDIIGIAYDATSGTVTFYKNGNSLGLISGVTARSYYFAAADYWSGQSAIYIWNFGQRPFAYTAPSGFKALNTANLPAPVITKPSDNLGIALYSGNNGSNTITTGVDASTGGGLLWIKGRSIAAVHNVLDNVRGYGTPLELPLTAAEYSYSNGVTATSTGFTQNNGSGQYNQSGYTYVAWHWKAGGSAVTNTAGSISSQVSANASAGFSIVTYTGTGSTASVGHGLNALPQMIIVKRRDSTSNWAVYHRTLGANTYLFLNSTAASAAISNYWQYTPSPGNPTSDWFGIIGGNDVNVSSATYVAYCFAAVAGYSSFGSYTGNGSADGPFVYTGFRPKFLLTKRTDNTESWLIYDTSRNTYNVADLRLRPNASNAEVTITTVDILSNGFKWRTGAAGEGNDNGSSYIYVAYAESPFQYARAR